MATQAPFQLVMLVDDNDTDNFISKRIIELTQFSERVEIKNSGKSALEYLHSCVDRPELIPELIFLDLNMPIVDGFVFLFEFEQLPSKVKDQTKVVVLTSSDNRHDMNRVVDHECVIKFITKPLSEDHLKDVRLKFEA